MTIVRKRIYLILILLLLIAVTLCSCAAPLPVGPNTPAQTIAGGETTQHETDSPHESPVPHGQISFLFFSDTQADPETGDYSAFGELLRGALSVNDRPDLVIFGGDTVNEGGSETEWRDFRFVTGDYLAGLTTAAAAGNHDNYPLLTKQFNYPDETPLDFSRGFFYTLAAGPVFFVVLDSNVMGAANESDIEWLRQELQSEAAKDAAFIIAVMHHPMWPVVANPKDAQRAETMREHFLRILEDSGVALILCGHQHNYARTQPQTGETGDGGEPGITQIMAASGGKDTYTPGDFDYICLSAPAPNYLLVKADGESVTASAFDKDHVLIDQVIIRKGETKNPVSGDNSRRIRVLDSSGEELWSFTEAELQMLPPERSGVFSHIYSSINNWPSVRYYAAAGYSVLSILDQAGALESFQTITFRAEDGYETVFTRDQLLSDHYYYPKAGESAEGHETVFPIIAYRWREGTTDMNDIREDKPSLIIGQRTPNEHTNPAFVIGVAGIIVSETPCEKWEPASTFPLPGPIAEGETVKLQHAFYGLVKMHYTLDGSDPTTLSQMYNTSTYQPELNVPIPITEPTVIKVLVTGYGKNDSDIAVFEFTPT